MTVPFYILQNSFRSIARTMQVPATIKLAPTACTQACHCFHALFVSVLQIRLDFIHYVFLELFLVAQQYPDFVKVFPLLFFVSSLL